MSLRLFTARVLATLAILAGIALASTFACGPPPDGWQGAGRSFVPPPSSPSGDDSGADSEAPTPPVDAGPDRKD
jgi:hypothetical protein